jgi:peptidoglycan/xylan/chitin deacetylase (PgdA/CDA1 family)
LPAWPVSFDNGATSLPLVSLTFDGGSLNNIAAAILDTLAAHEVKATMFLTGRFITNNKALVRRIVREGHEVGNHTYSHPHLTNWARDRAHTTKEGVSYTLVATQLEKTRRVFEEITGQSMTALWRAPYGERNRQICRWAQREGYLHVGWRQGRTWRMTLDTHDWVPDTATPGYRTPREVLDKILALSRSAEHGINGGIILMHLGTIRTPPAQRVHRILGTMIDTLQHAGYRFVTAGEMVRASGITLPETPSPRHGVAMRER